MRLLCFTVTLVAVLAGCFGQPKVNETSPSPRFPLLENEEALKKLPGAEGRLPAWALALVDSLPRTTAAMLELDYLQRAKNPLGELPAAKLRWVVADAMKCAYSKRTAEGDMRRLGLKDEDFEKLAGDS